MFSLLIFSRQLHCTRGNKNKSLKNALQRILSFVVYSKPRRFIHILCKLANKKATDKSRGVAEALHKSLEFSGAGIKGGILWTNNNTNCLFANWRA